MSTTPLPFRGQCIQVHGTIACGCPWFIPSASLPLLDQSGCAVCGHGIHGHVDYVSMFVHRCVATQCAAYAQKTPQTQGCTCSAQIADHGLATNQYRPVDPSDIAGSFMDSVQVNGLSSKVDVSDPSHNASNVVPVYSPSTNVHSPELDIIPSQAYTFGALPPMEDTLTYFVQNKDFNLRLRA